MSEFEDVKPYTQAELDQQAIWANEFDQWWENEGQYQRAGGGQYERTFAWWAWLNREQKQQAIIDEHTEVIKLQDADLRKYEKQIESLKAQLNNMEACYIEKKKEVEGVQGRLKTWKGKSLAAILHGTCKCGEPWQSIVSDREGFNLLHCFNCSNDRYENKEFFGDHEPKSLRGAND